MRIYSWLLVAVLCVCAFGSAQAATLQESQNNAAKKMDELRQYDTRNAGLQTDWDKEAVRVDVLQPSLQEKQAAYEKKKAYAWMKYQRREKTVEVLEAYALVYEQKSSEMVWSEGIAQVPDTGKTEDAAKALRQAEATALEKANRAIAGMIASSTDFSLLEHPVIAVATETVSSDSNGQFGIVKQVKLPDGAFLEAKVRLQVKPVALNPYRLAAQVLRDELKVARLDLLRQFPSLKDSTLEWNSNLVAVRANGEPGVKIALPSFAGLITDGHLRVSKELVERDYTDIASGLFQLQLILNLPEGINGDEAKLELVLRDRETKGTKHLALQYYGQDGSARYEYQSFTPPIITLAAGSTILPNSRLRVGETTIRLESERPSIVTVELKNGEIAAYSSGKLSRKTKYEGKIGQLKMISLTVPGFASIDSIKLFENGVLVLSEDFNREGKSNIQLNSAWK